MATDFQSKKQAALDLLAQTGIWRSSYAPPLSHILWALGFKARPPHFNGFLANFLTMGIYFGVAMAAIFYVFVQPINANFGGAVVSAPLLVASVYA